MQGARKMQFARRRTGLKLDANAPMNSFFGTVGSPIKLAKFESKGTGKENLPPPAPTPGKRAAPTPGKRAAHTPSNVPTAKATKMSEPMQSVAPNVATAQAGHRAERQPTVKFDEPMKQAKPTGDHYMGATNVPSVDADVATIRAGANGRRRADPNPAAPAAAQEADEQPARMTLEEARNAQIKFFKSDWFEAADAAPGAAGGAPPVVNNAQAPVQRTPANNNPPASNASAIRSYSYSSSAGSRACNQAINFADIQLGRMIGEGAFGKVHEGEWKGKSVAVKLLICQELRNDILHEFQQEIEIMSVLRHPNICRLLGACMDPPHRALVVELLQRGSLWGVLRTNRRSIDFNMRCKFIYDTAKGMSYLHHFERPILHRDLKSPNLLVDKNYNIKISDFGLARVKAHVQTMTGNCGTVQWMAPEVLGNQKYTEKADVFSFGIVIWEVVTGECPYDGVAQIQVALGVLNRDLRPPIPRECPQFLVRLMKACWNRQPDLRPSFPHIVNAFRSFYAREANGGSRPGSLATGSAATNLAGFA